jgi:hypothetical protein
MEHYLTCKYIREGERVWVGRQMEGGEDERREGVGGWTDGGREDERREGVGGQMEGRREDERREGVSG